MNLLKLKYSVGIKSLDKRIQIKSYSVIIS